MADDFYEEVDQKVYMVRESSFLTPYLGTKVTALTATYPYLIPVPIIADGFEYDLPRRLKEKLYGIGGGKHPMAIVNTKQEPVTFTIETKMQTAQFLSYAIASGAASSVASHTDAHEGTITCVADSSDSLDGTYFLIESIDAEGNGEMYCVWIDTDDSGTTYPGPTEIPEANRIEVSQSGGYDSATTISTDANATAVGGSVELALESIGITSSASEGVITWACDNAGAVMAARDSGTAPTGFAFATTTNGASTHTISEGTGRDIPSFTLHIEQNQDTTAEDYKFDLFGCVVNSYTMTIDYENGLVNESVEIMCPHYAVANRNTELPPQFDAVHVPHAWVNLTEAASKYLLMTGTTDVTPKVVTKSELKISNNVTMLPEIGYSYAQHVVAGKREVSLNIVGFADDSDRLTDYLDTWTNSSTAATNYYTTTSARINSLIKLQRESTYDNFELAIYNWLIDSHSLKVFPIEDKIMGIDITLSDATPDGNKRIFNSFVVKDYLPEYQYEYTLLT